MASLFGGAVSSLTAPSTNAAGVPAEPRQSATAPAPLPSTAADRDALALAAKDLADYQRLTTEG
jgi:hypothetical protein